MRKLSYRDYSPVIGLDGKAYCALSAPKAGHEAIILMLQYDARKRLFPAIGILQPSNAIRWFSWEETTPAGYTPSSFFRDDSTFIPEIVRKDIYDANLESVREVTAWPNNSQIIDISDRFGVAVA